MKFEWKKKRGKNKCMFCGLCIASCPNQLKGALRFNKSNENLNYDDEIIHNPKKCSWCGMCEKVCPERMIKIQEEK